MFSVRSWNAPPALDPARIDDVYFGNANEAGEENRNVARMAVLLAGLPVSVPGATVNRLCASGLEAVVQAVRAVAVSDARVVIPGSVESMSRAPCMLPKPDRPFPPGNQALLNTTLGWRMTNPKMRPQWTIALGEGAELIADRHGISRQAQDAFALASHDKAAGPGRTGRTTRRWWPTRRPRSTGTRPSARTPRSTRWPGCGPRSARAARSRPATPCR